MHTRPFFSLLLLGALTLSACDSIEGGNGDPNRVFIREIRVNDAPLMNGTDDWDVGILGASAPDIYVELYDEISNDSLLSTRSAEAGNVDAGDFPLSWAFNPHLEIRERDWNRSLSIDLWDKDVDDNDDYMGSTPLFDIDDIAAEGFPTTYDLVGDDISVELVLRWEN